MKKIILTLLIMCMTVTNSLAVTRITTITGGFEKNTPLSNVFSLSDNATEFVLLDEFEDGYLVIMKKYASPRMPFDPDNTGKFDVEDSNNIAYWLNNDYITNPPSDVTAIPEQMLEYIVEREWVTEGGHISKGFTEDYITKCKVVLMSQTEYQQYCLTEKVLGTYDDTSNGYWLFRTTDSSSNTTGEYASGIMVCTAATAVTGHGKAITGCGIRPMFVLSKEFFINEKINISSSGSAVLNIVKDALGVEGISAMYGSATADRLDKLIVPGAQSIKIDGMNIVGRELVGSYTYVSPDGKAEYGTKFRWLRSNTKDGYYTPIKGATTQTYTTTEADAGKYIKFQVIPQTRINTGFASSSEAFLLKSESLPMAYDVEVVGTGKSGEELYADYHYLDINQEPQMNVYYKWQVSSDGNVFTDIADAAEQTFVPGDEYCGKYIRTLVRVDKLGNGSYPSAGYAHSQAVLIHSKPHAQNVSLSGTQSLNGSYTYVDAFSDEGQSICEWEISSDKDGEYLSFANGNDITPPKLSYDYYIRYSVTPVNSEGTYGDKTSSESICIQGNSTHAEAASLTFNQNGDLSVTHNEFCTAIVAELQSSSDKLELSSEIYDIVITGKNGRFVCVFTPKNGDAAYTEGVFAQVISGTDIQLINSNLFTLSNK